jgi:phosphoglycolate phosphatase-like HAD superfamily hydrolase
MTKSAGVRMVGVTTGHHSGKQLADAGADRVVGSLEEFVALIPDIQ